MASRIEERPRERERERITEEEIRLEPMLHERDYEKLYGMRAWLRDRVRLAPVFAGLFIAFAASIFLTTLGIWVGFITVPPVPEPGAVAGLATGLGIWAVVASLLALFLGGWYAARMAGVAGRLDGILNGLAVWGTFIFFGVLLGTLGITRLLGVGALAAIPLANGAVTDPVGALQVPGQVQLTPEQVEAIRATTADAALGVWLGTLIAAAAAMLGGFVGARSRSVSVTPPRP